MKKVSLRDFQLKPSKYIGDLPIEITRYGKSIAQVTPLLGLPTTAVMEDISEDLSKKSKEVVETCNHGYPEKMCTKCKK